MEKRVFLCFVQVRVALTNLMTERENLNMGAREMHFAYFKIALDLFFSSESMTHKHGEQLEYYLI